MIIRNIACDTGCLDIQLGLEFLAESRMKTIARYMEEMGISLEELTASSGLDAKSVSAIVSGNYTASPSQRHRLAGAEA